MGIPATDDVTAESFSKLDLSPGDRIQPEPDDQWYLILHDFLRDESSATLETAKNSLLALLPYQRPGSSQAWELTSWFAALAHAIPPEHSSAQKLIDLIAQIHADPHWSNGDPAESYDQMSMVIRDQLDIEEGELEGQYNEEGKWVSSVGNLAKDLEWRNFQSFAARLKMTLWPDRSGTDWWSLWALEAAHEGGCERLQNTMRDAFPLGAAEWIFNYGHILHRHAVTNGKDIEAYTGPLWDAEVAKLYTHEVAKDELGIHRWSFWKERFRALSIGHRDHEYAFSGFTKSKAAEAVAFMDRIEESWTNASGLG